MARRAIWRGVVSFGMVAIPIKLYLATESKDVSFVTMHKTCHTRLKQKRHCPTDEVEVGTDEIVRAYEYAKDEYVVMEDKDFENLPVPSVHTIQITQFVDLSEIDPMNFDRSYILEPEGVGAKPFYLLKQALQTTTRAAIGKVSLRQKEHICCLRPYNHSIALHTMHYADEIHGTEDLILPEEQTAITEPEMSMATALIDQLTGSYDPSEQKDEYRLALERTIEAKLGAQLVVTAAPQKPKGKVTDLMEALRASIAEAKKRRSPAEEAEKDKKGASTGGRSASGSGSGKRKHASSRVTRK